MGLSTVSVNGTVLPFSAISAISSVSLPSMGLASPRSFFSASQGFDRACPGQRRQPRNQRKIAAEAAVNSTSDG